LKGRSLDHREDGTYDLGDDSVQDPGNDGRDETMAHKQGRNAEQRPSGRGEVVEMRSHRALLLCIRGRRAKSSQVFVFVGQATNVEGVTRFTGRGLRAMIF
jgi:hypothetical protein